MAEPHWVRRFAERRAPGAYLRVVTPGTVAVGDVMHAHEAPAHGITLADVSSPARDGALVALLEAERHGLVALAEGMRWAALRGAARD
jgi:MOSC domain-containing protein YiiM